MGQSKTKTESKRDPWAPAQPLLKDMATKAQGYLDDSDNRSYFPGSTVAPQSQYTEQAVGQMANAGGNQVTKDMGGFLSRTMQGDYLDGNPNLDAVTSSIQRSVMPSINASFGGAGRSGSPAHQYSMQKGMADAIAPYAFKNYENERGRQMQAAGMAPGYQGLQNQNIGLLERAGQIDQRQSQAELNDEIGRFNFGQDQDLNDLRNLLPIATGIGGMGGTSTSVNTKTPSVGSQIMGGGMMAAGLMTGNPMMMMNGAGGLSGGGSGGGGGNSGLFFGV